MAKILIIDDNPSILALFGFVLAEAGHTVSAAANGREAIEALGRGLPDFMMLDVDMPVMGGEEFIRELARLSARNPALNKIPFLVMTGENFMKAGINSAFARRPGFVCFLPKMTPPEQVLETITKRLGGGA